jgi:hypothetical protein
MKRPLQSRKLETLGCAHGSRPPRACQSHWHTYRTLEFGVVIFMVIIHKAPRRIQEDERHPGRSSSPGFPPLAPTMRAGQDWWIP